MNISTRALLLSTALTLPMAGSAFAQQIEINPDQLSGKSNECQILGQVIADNDGSVGELAAQDVVAAINEDAADLCATYVEELEVFFAGGADVEGDVDAVVDLEADAEAEVQVSEEVQATEQIDVEAEAQASVPAPDVDVVVPGSDVSVTPATPTVVVDQGASEIEIEQPQPTVSVAIPEIIVRVEIPAPNLYVLQSDPSVSVALGDPEVAVQQAEAQVEVTQPDPNVTIALTEGDVGSNATPVPGGGADVNASADQQVGGNVTTTRGDPTVQIVQNDEQPQVQINDGGEPTVSYLGSDPEVDIQFAQQPSVEIIQSGQPVVTFETAEEREQRQSGMATEAADMDASAVESSEMMVGDILGMEVLTAEGDSLGSPNAVIEMDGQQMLVVSSGGFLGLGDTEVPVALDNVTMQDGQIVLQQMTEEQIANAESFEYDPELALSEDSPVLFGE